MTSDHVVRGFLGKLGASKVLWAKRWCVLKAPSERISASFDYFKNKDDENPLHSIELSMYDTAETTDETGRPYSFKIRNSWDKKAREYFFAGDSEITTQSWVDAIKQVFANKFQVSHFERMRLGDLWLHNAESGSLIGGNVKVKTDLYSINLENQTELSKLEKERKQLLSGNGLKEAWSGNSPSKNWNLNFFPIKNKDSLRDLIFSVDLREIDNINYDEGKALICIILRAKSTEYFFYISKAYKDYWLQKLSAVCNSYKQNTIEQTEQSTHYETQPNEEDTKEEIDSQQFFGQIPQLLTYVTPETVSPKLKSPTKEKAVKTQLQPFPRSESNQTIPLQLSPRINEFVKSQSQSQSFIQSNPNHSIPLQTQQLTEQNSKQAQMSVQNSALQLSPRINEFVKSQSQSFIQSNPNHSIPLQTQQLYEPNPTLSQTLQVNTQNTNQSQPLSPPINELVKSLSFTQLYSDPTAKEQSLSYQTQPMIEQQQFNPIIEYERPLSQFNSPLVEHHSPLSHPTNEEQQFFQPTTELTEQTQQTVNEQTSPQFTTTQTHVRPPAPKNPPRLKRNQ